MVKKLVAFPYYGGKNSHLSWLLPLLPYDTKYIEPFAGSAAVLLNRERSDMEVYNDIDRNVVNFFRVLRDQGDALIEKLALTPYSKYEHEHCLDHTDDDLERARRFFIKLRQTFMTTADARTWAISPKEVRSGFSQVVSRWLNGIAGLHFVVDRFRGVAIECRPALVVIPRYDSLNTVFYCDPPYPHETRATKEGYDCEMTFEDHKELLECLKSCEGKVALSGYASDLYDSTLKGWFRYEDREKSLAGPRGMRQEILWTNYDPREIRTKHQTGLMEFCE